MRLILIGGAQRSGTTLLQTLLANRLQAPLLPEAHILCDVANAYKRAKDVWSKTRLLYPTGEALRGFFERFAGQHVEDIARSSAYEVLVLKDPNFIHVYQELAELFPDAVLISCLRDPRDIAASFIEIGKREPANGKPGKYQRRDIRFIAKKILAAYTPLMTDSLQARVYRVFYEKLVQTTEKALEELACEAGLDFSSEGVAKASWLPAEARHSPAWQTSLEEGDPSPDRVGIYRKVLSPEEIRIVEQICEPVFNLLGYERSTSEVAPGRKELARARLGHLIRKVTRWTTSSRSS